MMGDLWTIVWKEGREFTTPQGRGWWSILNLTYNCVWLFVFGVGYPLLLGLMRLTAPLDLVLAFVTFAVLRPIMVIPRVIADSVAGERERQTLEPMLTTRLSARTLMLGKLSFAVIYGSGLTLLTILTGMLVVALLQLPFLPVAQPAAAVTIVALSILTAGITGEVGVLVSMDAHGVAQATNNTIIWTFVLLVIGPTIGTALVLQQVYDPSVILGALQGTGPLRLTAILARVDWATTAPATLGVLVLFNLLLLGRIVVRSRRTQLIRA